MESVQVFVEDLIDRFRRPSPSLLKMDLGVRADSQNPLMIQFFEWDSQGSKGLSWWQFFELEVPELAKMGFTQAWLPPPNKAMVKDGRGYDAYDLWDLGEFDQKEGRPTRWGTKEQLINASQVAKAHGIGVIIDAVLNHKLGADRTEVFKAVEVDSNDRNVKRGPIKEIEGWTAYDYPGRNMKYSTLQWRKEHFTGVDFDRRTCAHGIFRIDGKSWSKRVDKENGNYDYLLGADIDHRHPAVQSDLLAWGAWVLTTLRSNGFRLDAIKHMDRKYLLKFIRNAKRNGHPRLFAVAECWSDSYTKVKKYIRAMQGEVSFFDVPLHYNFHRASQTGARYDLCRLLKGTLVQKSPGDAVTFVDNHDTQVGQTLESWVASSFKVHAYAIILLRTDGYPCVFYGDLYPCSFHDPILGNVLKQLIYCRRDYAYGPQTDYISNSLGGRHNLIGFTRHGEDRRPTSGCAVLISNAAFSGRDDPEHESRSILTMRMNIGKRNANKIYRNILENRQLGNVNTDTDGWGVFRCVPGGVAVWIRV